MLAPLDLDQRLKVAAVANNSGAVGGSPGNHRREEREEAAMGNTETSRSRNLKTTIIVGGSVAAIAAVGLLASVVVAPRAANALPAYAQKEGKACGYCHVNPAGGGARNAKGKQYQANGHSFKKKK
jgi:hypothetical protein